MSNNVASLAALQERQGAASRDPMTPSPEWPKLAQEARHGLAGRYLEMIEPHTEADPVGILLQFLVMVGNLIGRKPHFRVEADRHYLNLFAVLVGESSKGRKGVSAGQAKRLLDAIDDAWRKDRIMQGLSSGEGLIWQVRDLIEKVQPVKKNGKVTGSETVVVDEGVDDKRLLVLEAEFASALRVLKREGNTLSAIVRGAWDSGDLQTMTKNSPAKATGAHISIIGHITKAEALRYLDQTEAANGFGNRFLWCGVRRSKVLPEGGAADSLDLGPLICELTACVEFARNTSEIRRDDEAREVWASVYPELSAGKPGLLGAIVGRGEAQTMRLACLYALLDRSALIRTDHLMAALGLWTYCEESARWVFGNTLGDPVADEILRALRQAEGGLTRTQIRDLFGKHRTRESSRALGVLLGQGLVTLEKESTGGRPTERWRAAMLENRSEGGPLLSHKSLLSHSSSESGDPSRNGDDCDKSDKRSADQRKPPERHCDISDKSDNRSGAGSQVSSHESDGDKSDISDKSPDGQPRPDKEPVS